MAAVRHLGFVVRVFGPLQLGGDLQPTGWFHCLFPGENPPPCDAAFSPNSLTTCFSLVDYTA